MCGLCGFANLARSPLADRKVLELMTDRLRHRGPDEKGLLEEDHFSFGHRRLKVIDLEGGQQPMKSDDGRVTLVYNGEIYNFQEIRHGLEKKGVSFHSRSDTESLLRLYEEKGMGCLKDLRGMFSFAVFDQRVKKLYLAVDRFGKKPLFYFHKGQELIFSSEIRSLIKHPSVSKEVDPRTLSEYLAFEYVPAPKTILKGIHKLEAGTFLEFHAEGIRIEQYDVFKPDTSLIRGLRSPREVLDELKKAIKRRLVSDVPLGVFLSGGLDSGSLVALIREMEPARHIKTFTIGFDEPSFDESRAARFISERYGTDHITETCTLSQMVREHESILAALDEPLADASFLPTYMLCRLARKHVTVALAGDGGDELFLGYQSFLAEKYASYMDHLPRWIPGFMSVMARRLPVSWKNLSPDFLIKQFFKGYFYPEALRRQIWLGAFSELEAQSVLAEPFKGYAGEWRDFVLSAPGSEGPDLMERSRDFYFRFFLQGDILVKVDRASMANSLEVRAPLLDDDFVNIMRSIPARQHMKGRRLKSIFRDSLKGVLPPAILNKGKKGFGIPISQWIRKDLRKEFESTLDWSHLNRHGFFDPKAVREILREHLSGKKDNRKRLWSLYVFQKWYEENLH